MLNVSRNELSGAAQPHIPRRIEKRLGIARPGPPLPETLRLLAPLAPTLEQLDLSGNMLGGTITADIMAFTRLTQLELRRMGLEGASRGLPRHTARTAAN